MIYTIGHTESYERYFAEQKQPVKVGRTDDYPGGCVWRTRHEAEEYCPDGYSVYGVEADWEEGTEPNEIEPWRDLLRDAPLIQLEKEAA